MSASEAWLAKRAALYSNEVDLPVLRQMLGELNSTLCPTGAADTEQLVAMNAGLNLGLLAKLFVDACPRVHLYGFEVQRKLYTGNVAAFRPYPNARIFNLGLGRHRHEPCERQQRDARGNGADQRLVGAVCDVREHERQAGRRRWRRAVGARHAFGDLFRRPTRDETTGSGGTAAGWHRRWLRTCGCGWRVATRRRPTRALASLAMQ